MSDIINNIENSTSGYNSITNFYAKYKNERFSSIDVSLCGFIYANMASPLGALFDKLKNNLNTLSLSIQKKGAQIILQKNRFLSSYGYDQISDTNNTALPYVRYKLTENAAFVGYVDKWLLNRPEMPNLSTGLHRKILEGIGEIFANAALHSQSEYIYVCGQFFPNNHLLYLTIADTGKGIKNTVNAAIKKDFNAIDAIKWAMIDGHTTKTDTPGGYGLNILRQLITTNKGCLQIVSNDGFYQLDTNGEKTENLSNEFPGTVVTLQFRTDDNHSYSLKGENI